MPDLAGKVQELSRRPLKDIVKWVSHRIDGGLRYHVGPTSLNRAGFQVFRSLYKTAGWHLRDLPVGDELKGYVADLDRDGCITIPDFLPKPVFDAMRAEYERSFVEQTYEVWVVEDNNVMEQTFELAYYPGAMPLTEAALVQNATLQTIVAGALRRPVAPARVWSKRWYLSETPLKARALGHVIGSNYLHADVHYPTFKAFFYMNDVDESNGAFTFAIGSHRMTPARLAYEYESSVRVAKLRGTPEAAEVPAGLARHPTERQLADMKIQARSINGRANTLVIANTAGFHRQGDFQLGKTRDAIAFCYRSSEPGFIKGKRMEAPKSPGPANEMS